MDQEQEKGGLLKDAKGLLSWVLALALCVRKPMELLLRRPGTAGRRHFGDVFTLIGLFGLDAALLSICGSQWECRVVACTMIVLVWFLAMHALGKRQGEVYSYWSGNVWWNAKDHLKAKQKTDAPLALLLGVVAGAVLECPPLIYWGVAAAVAFIITGAWVDMDREARRQAMVDRMAEAQDQAEMMQDIRGE